MPAYIEKAKYATITDWKNPITSNKVDNHMNNRKIDTFREKQKQLTSNILPTGKDYSKFQPITKKFIDLDNLYDSKRNNDPLYSDLFD